MINCDFGIAAIARLWESVLSKECSMRNVLQGKSVTWNECDIKECTEKNAQC